MNKNEFINSVRPVAIGLYHEFRGHYWTYGSLTLAGLAAGIYAGRQLRAHEAVHELCEETQQFVADHEVVMEQQVVEAQQAAEQIAKDAAAA